MKPNDTHDLRDCRRVGEILSRIGDKWSVLVVSRLGRSAMRFGELKAEIGGISQKMLTATLRSLERDGFVQRTVFPVVPPRVEYALTALGRELLVPVHALGAWAVTNMDRVEAARARYDEAALHPAGRLPQPPKFGRIADAV